MDKGYYKESVIIKPHDDMMSVCAFCHNRWIDCDVQTLINYPQPQREAERQRKGFIE